MDIHSFSSIDLYNRPAQKKPPVRITVCTLVQLLKRVRWHAFGPSPGSAEGGPSLQPRSSRPWSLPAPTRAGRPKSDTSTPSPARKLRDLYAVGECRRRQEAGRTASVEVGFWLGRALGGLATHRQERSPHSNLRNLGHRCLWHYFGRPSANKTTSFTCSAQFHDQWKLTESRN